MQAVVEAFTEASASAPPSSEENIVEYMAKISSRIFHTKKGYL